MSSTGTAIPGASCSGALGAFVTASVVPYQTSWGGGPSLIPLSPHYNSKDSQFVHISPVAMDNSSLPLLIACIPPSFVSTLFNSILKLRVA